jgi:hypothetical protein
MKNMTEVKILIGVAAVSIIANVLFAMIMFKSAEGNNVPKDYTKENKELQAKYEEACKMIKAQSKTIEKLKKELDFKESVAQVIKRESREQIIAAERIRCQNAMDRRWELKQERLRRNR